MLASLISASKLGATGASGMMSMGKNLNKWGTGKIKAGAGAATFGAGGRLARRAVGGYAQRRADKLSEDPNYGKKGLGKLNLKTLRKIGDSSFDARNTGVGKKMNLGTGIKGGYKTKVEEARKADETYADSLKGNSNVQATDADGKGVVDSDGNAVMLSQAEAYSKDNKTIWSRFSTGATEGLEQASKAREETSTNKAELKKIQRELKRKKEIYEDARKKIGSPQISNQNLVQKEVDDAREILTNFEDKVDNMKEKIKKAAEKAKAGKKPKEKKESK